MPSQMKPCAFGVVSPEQGAAQNGLPERCRVALLMKKGGHRRETIRWMLGTDGWKAYKDAMPPEVLKEAVCDVREPYECPLDSYFPVWEKK